MQVVGRLHQRRVFGRRTHLVTRHLAGLLPENARILDVGCGDGTIDRLLIERRPDCTIAGIDVLVRHAARIPVQVFDGVHLPYAHGTFDAVLFVDVLHHTRDPLPLLLEARRVALQAVIIKDHLRSGLLAGPTLRFMDWVGNAHHGVALPYNYLTHAEWNAALRTARLRPTAWRTRLGLYPAPASWLFDRSLHFVARMEPV